MNGTIDGILQANSEITLFSLEDAIACASLV